MDKATYGLGAVIFEVEYLLSLMVSIGLIYNTSNSGLPNDDYVNAITIDGLGNKWIGTNNGLAKFDGVNWAVYNTSNSGLPDNSVNSAIAIDGQGNKWISNICMEGLQSLMA
jgi:ligand-binding sensor domain-containing protein